MLVSWTKRSVVFFDVCISRNDVHYMDILISSVKLKHGCETSVKLVSSCFLYRYTFRLLW